MKFHVGLLQQAICRLRCASFFSRTHQGQALVETAIMVTLLAILFLAAVDLGLAYKAYQTLVNASAETATYVSQYPLRPCGSGYPTSCPSGISSGKSFADYSARTTFRDEQAGALSGIGSTRDLNADGAADTMAETTARVRIEEADGDQALNAIGSDNFALISDPSTFTTTTNSECLARDRVDRAGKQCFIVVRAESMYRPFFLSPALGNTMTIRAIAVRPIVGMPN